MSIISEIEQSTAAPDFELGIAGFRFSDLFDAVKLAELTEIFYNDLHEKEPVVGRALRKYITTDGEGLEKRAVSKILTDSAPRLSDFMRHKSPRRGRRAHLVGDRCAMSQWAGRPVQLLELHRPSRPGQGRMGVTLMSTALAVPPSA